MMSLLYPVLISLVAIAVVVLMLTFVVPKVVDMFDHIGQQLPILTRGLIAISDFISGYGIYLALVLAMGFLFFLFLLRNEKIRFQFHRVLLRLPLIAKLVRGLYRTFCQNV